MNFINPDILSSYNRKTFGNILYSTVIKNNCKTIIDFGLLNGYSTVCLALGAKETGGHVIAYDIFEEYDFKRANKKTILNTLKKYNLENYVTVKEKNFYDWIKTPESFDLLHVDISNTGETIKCLYENLKNKNNVGIVLFEGGSEERDKNDWMIKFNKIPMRSLLSNISFRVLEKDSYEENGRIMHPALSQLIF
jgi:hypothetical protein